MADSTAFAAWRASILRSTRVLQKLGVFVVEKGEPDKIMKAFHLAIVDAAAAETNARAYTSVGEFAPELTKSLAEPGRASRDDQRALGYFGGSPVTHSRLMTLVAALADRGWEMELHKDDEVAVFRRDGEEILVDGDGEFVWRTGDVTVAGDSIKELQQMTDSQTENEEED